MTTVNQQWQSICAAKELEPLLGVRALVGNKQIAIFKVQDKLYAIDAIDPFTNAAVLSRGIVGDLKGTVVVASPIYKQHFCLESGQCLEDDEVKIGTYEIREENDAIEVKVA